MKKPIGDWLPLALALALGLIPVGYGLVATAWVTSHC